LDSSDELEVVEENVTGYTSSVSGSVSEGYTITNTLDNPQNNTAPDDPTNDDGDDSTDDSGDTSRTSAPVKKTASDKKPVKKTKDKHNTGNPILLGILPLSAAGMTYNLRRNE
jgi:hypothetical protein